MSQAKDDLEKKLSTSLSVKTDELASNLSKLADQEEECKKLHTICDKLEFEVNAIKYELNEKCKDLEIAEDYYLETVYVDLLNV